jgi:hypothetical protein
VAAPQTPTQHQPLERYYIMKYLLKAPQNSVKAEYSSSQCRMPSRDLQWPPASD